MAKMRFYEEGSSKELNYARRKEAQDFAMISEDHSAIANLPQAVKYEEWPKVGHYASYDLDDTIRGIDKQMDADGAGMRKHKSRNKY
jgi:hypothetical protein